MLQKKNQKISKVGMFTLLLDAFQTLVRDMGILIKIVIYSVLLERVDILLVYLMDMESMVKLPQE